MKFFEGFLDAILTDGSAVTTDGQRVWAAAHLEPEVAKWGEDDGEADNRIAIAECDYWRTDAGGALPIGDVSALRAWWALRYATTRAVVFDSGGGILLMWDTYTHHYSDPAQAAHDVAELLSPDGEDPRHWDGNEPAAWIEFDAATEVSGGYHWITLAPSTWLADAMARLPADIAGQAEREFFAALSRMAGAPSVMVEYHITRPPRAAMDVVRLISECDGIVMRIVSEDNSTIVEVHLPASRREMLERGLDLCVGVTYAYIGVVDTGAEGESAIIHVIVYDAHVSAITSLGDVSLDYQRITPAPAGYTHMTVRVESARRSATAARLDEMPWVIRWWHGWHRNQWL